LSPDIEKIKFHPLFTVKDLNPICWTTVLLIAIISKSPDILGDVENLNPANPLVTPIHIQPE